MKTFLHAMINHANFAPFFVSFEIDTNDKYAPNHLYQYLENNTYLPLLNIKIKDKAFHKTKIEIQMNWANGHKKFETHEINLR